MKKIVFAVVLLLSSTVFAGPQYDGGGYDSSSSFGPISPPSSCGPLGYALTSDGACGTTWSSLADDLLVVHLAGTETITGAKTFTQTILGDISGNAATVTTIPTLSGEVTNAGNNVTLSNSAVTSKVLTGYTSGAGTVVATDSILQAIQKLNGNTVANDALVVHLAGIETITGAKTFSLPIAGSITGNSATATALQTARTINGTSFNGTADITITAAAGTLTGTTLNPTVVTSSLTSVGTLSVLDVFSNATIGNNLSVSDIFFRENPVNGTEFVGFISSDSVPSSIVWSLPATDSIGTQALVSDGFGVLSWQSTWLLAGNSGTSAGSDFIGTTDAQDVVFKRDNTEIFRIVSGGIEIHSGNIFRNVETTFTRISGGADNSGGRIEVYGSSAGSDSNAAYVRSDLTAFFDNVGNELFRVNPSTTGLRFGFSDKLFKSSDSGSFSISGGSTFSGGNANISFFGNTSGSPGRVTVSGTTHLFLNATSAVEQFRINDFGIGLGMTPASGSRSIQMLGTATTPSAVAGSGILYVTSVGALRYRGPTTDSLIALP